ncbi:MAG TPA: MFS transporter, partial [Baekduia sp.]
MRIRHILLAVAAGLALADASIVTLALPQLLQELDTTVEGVASILGVYTVVLAATLLPAERLQRVYGAPRTGAAGLALFATASVVAGASGSLGMLLAARGVQAVGGAAALVAAFALLEPGGAAGKRGRRLWLGAAVLAAAVGPALGGALTEALSWRWIFFAQAPVAAIAAVVALGEPDRDTRPRGRAGIDSDEEPHLSPGPAAALALVSAALTAVLFLLVLLLVAGWDISPLHAAVTVTVIPAGALVGSRIGGEARARAAAGCALVGAGVLALAFLPDAQLLWTVVPQAAAGLGMGLALPALGGDLLPERDPQDAARLLVLRHVGIALALVVLAPIVSSNLATATERAKERGVAVVLDARLNPTDKLRL